MHQRMNLKNLLEESENAAEKKITLKKKMATKKIRLNNFKKFLEDILDGKINNKTDAAKNIQEKLCLIMSF